MTNVAQVPVHEDGRPLHSAVAAVQSRHKLDMKRGLPGTDLARALILAAERAPRTPPGMFSPTLRARTGMAAAEEASPIPMR
jgi:hypothetical protein